MRFCATGHEFGERVLCAALAAALFSPGCAQALRSDLCPTRTLAAPAPAVEVQYLGSGGFLVQRGADIALFSPVYSNPTAPEVFLGLPIRPEARLVDSLLPPAANRAQAIIIGHSHYDHLLDTPWVALNRAKSANIYGSRNTRRLIASIEPEMAARTPPNSIVEMDSPADQGVWVPIPGSRMRLRAIPSEHSDQFRINVAGLVWPLHAFRGDVSTDQRELPRTAADWVEGRTFAYLLDFLDALGNTEFRVYFQDSGTHVGVGFAPTHPHPDYADIDVALICGGGEFKGLQHPEGIIENTRPRHIIVSHWEDFFVTQRAICSEKQVRGLPFAKPQDFAKRARAAQRKAVGVESVFLPCPTASRFEIAIEPLRDQAKRKKETVSYDCTKSF